MMKLILESLIKNQKRMMQKRMKQENQPTFKNLNHAKPFQKVLFKAPSKRKLTDEDVIISSPPHKIPARKVSQYVSIHEDDDNHFINTPRSRPMPMVPYTPNTISTGR
jgi:hypothetical protein